MTVTRNAHLIVRYEGQADLGICLQRVGGEPQPAWFGIWPASWPEGAAALQAAREVLAGPEGTSKSFTASFDWIGNSFASSAVWRFTVRNEGIVAVPVSGQTRRAVKIGWEEQSLGRPYTAYAEFIKDLDTGVILAQRFRTVLGSSTIATDFWSRYGGGLGVVPDFHVTAMQ